ncbi:MAG: alpha/beta hydrolase [Actinomycetota bacterium]|nr:alpha/beta hydrolase [Actinomycetota bacterium]
MRLTKPLSIVTRLLVGGSPAGRAAAMLSTVAAGVSFTPSLMPRGRREQVLLTGLASAIQHGLVMNAQARHQVVAGLICSWTGHGNDPVGRRHTESLVAAGTTVAGLAAYAALPYRPGEPTERALLRTLGIRLLRIGSATMVVSAADEVERLYGERAPVLRVVAPATGFLAGAVISSGLIRRSEGYDPVIASRSETSVDRLTGQQLRPDATPEDRATSLPISLGMGLGVAVALNLVSGVEGVVSGWIADVVRRAVPGSDPYAVLFGHAAFLSGILGAVGVGVEYLYHHAEAGGSAIDAAYTTPPTSPVVSGGPDSQTDWQTLGREGVRLVAMSLSRQEIGAVTETPVDKVKDPIRCFAGLESAESVGARVGMVMEDLERFGAFDRSVILLTSPTGTGYINYVAIEALEYLTRGDCATVGIQYSLRPSFLSLDRVRMAREQNLTLLNAIVWRLRAIPEERRPRLLLFGESLGAQTLQNCFLHEGSAGLKRAGVSGALFLGTPAASRWASNWRSDPTHTDPDSAVVEVATVTEWDTALAARDTRPTYVLLNNHEDPITKFTPRMTVVRPDWLPRRGPRPPGVPKTAMWMPYTSMLMGLVDVVNALDFVPGVFVARGHDYRATIPTMVSQTYQLPVGDDEMLRIEHALRNRERTWAEKRVVAEEMARASQAVARQVRSWGELSSPSSLTTVPPAPAERPA